MLLGVRHALVGDALVPGDVRVDDGRIADVGVLPAGASGLAAPGYVDLQVNGFGGIDFLAAEPGDYRTAGAAIAATGVTAYLPTFITSAEEDCHRALEAAGRRAPRRGGGGRARPRGAPGPPRSWAPPGGPLSCPRAGPARTIPATCR